MGEGSRDPKTELIAAEIEATRADLGQTIDELQERLNPKRLIHALGRTGVEVRRHSFPLAMLALNLGLVLTIRRWHRRRRLLGVIEDTPVTTGLAD